jgi:hypothetical protein
MTITQAGLILGAGTVLAKRSIDARGHNSLAINGNEERILTLLAVAYNRAVDPAVIIHMEKASRAYGRGETCLALIHLAHSGLTRLRDEQTDSYRLFLAESLLDAGLMPRDLLAACGLHTMAAALRKAGYNPDEPRVPAGSGRESGEWTEAGKPNPAAAPRREGSDEYRTGDPDEFFDTVYTRFHALAQRLGVDETWLLGLAAHESGYLDPHNRTRNNPFGTTHGGGSNVHYDSIDAAVVYWERRYGPIVRDATNAEDFVNRLYSNNYNSNPAWPGLILNAIQSVRRRLTTWASRRGIR